MTLLSDYVIDFVAKLGVKHIFMVAGGGGMYLIDSLGNRKDIKYICNHHEQACAMSAEGYQRTTGNLGVALVTTGPAATNVITGLLCSWNDSIPVLILSGQSNSKFLIGHTGLRQRGVHEANITKIVESVTKYSVTVMDEKMIQYHLEKAIFLAKTGRPGPVWIDIPLDIQSKMIDTRSLIKFDAKKEFASITCSNDALAIKNIIHLLRESKRPIILAGHGIRLSGTQKEFLNFVEKYQIPVVTTKNSFDTIYYSHPMRVGSIGINGQRAANFAVQNADLVLCLGTRLAFPTIGYQTNWFAQEAKKIVIDIDKKQLKNTYINADVSLHMDLRDVFPLLNKKLGEKSLETSYWLKSCNAWKQNFPLVSDVQRNDKKYVNSYYFFDVLSETLSDTDIIVTDQGASFYSSTQAFKLKKGQRMFTNGGFSPMGYGLPAAIGACFGNSGKRVICVHGDGGLELNIQELQTIVHYNLPIKLFVFNNQGYLSIKHTQMAFFNGRFVGCDPNSGLSCPDMVRIAKAYRIPTKRIKNQKNLKFQLKKVLSKSGPMLIEIILDPMQPFIPKVTSERRPDGTMISKPLEDMYPFLSREEFYKNMIVDPIHK